MRAIAVFLTLGIGLLAAVGAPAPRPNFVFIVADDLGYGDCGVHGGRDIPTPHLDALAADGIRFTQAYVTGAVCSPTRAALMTGRHQLRDGVPDWIPPGKPGLDPAVPTLPGYLRKAGYRTALVGKWHLGEDPARHPLARGFDEFFGFLGGGTDYRPARDAEAKRHAGSYGRIVRGNEPVDEPEYLTTAFGREASAFIGRAAGKPFFLYLAFNAVHTPMQPPEGTDVRFKAIADPQRRAYAGMLSSMDDAIGRVLGALREAGVEKETVVAFLSDNGGPIVRNAPNGSSNTPLRGGKAETWEGGIRVPFFLRWPARWPGGRVETRPFVQMDLTATALALAGGTPERGWPMDGVDWVPFLDGRNGRAEPHPLLCWEYKRQWAVREGDWKLTYALPSKEAKEPVLGLFHLGEDPGETRDRAAEEPERVARMQAAWKAWRTGLTDFALESR